MLIFMSVYKIVVKIPRHLDELEVAQFIIKDLFKMIYDYRDETYVASRLYFCLELLR